ncbi:hypothetical protein ABT115_17420 [Streptomyces sp. NPDC001832]|uniref:hypothetical protein n=1 Tax=Streptomyces sp. NPDC001832 TaxID=3154527 RepID=UPI003318E34D
MVRRWVPALVLGGVWWWAVLRLVLEPAHAGLVEGAVAAGGWGLSLLPVHVAATAGPTGASGADAGAGRWPALCAGRWSGVGMWWLGRWSAVGMQCVSRWSAVGMRRGGWAWRTTRAWLRRRSGGGPDRS